MDCSDHQQIGIDQRIIQGIPCTPGQFSEKHTLCSSVSLSEWMKIVDTAVEICDLLDERLSVQALEVIHISRTSKDFICQFLELDQDRMPFGLLPLVAKQLIHALT